MRTTVFTLLGLAASTAYARPSIKTTTKSSKRFSIQGEDDATTGKSDVTILQYALTLEHLEATFYRQGLANFTAAQFATAGFDATFYANLQRVAADEANHVAFLTTGLTSAGAVAPAECVYNFPYTDPASFVALASVLEGVGVSAYLGAAADIASKDYLTAAGSILTVEARHASYLRSRINESPFPAPYDTPLDFDQVHSLAWPFFVSCPAGNPPLGVTAFPRLSVAAAAAAIGPIGAGTNITISSVNGYVIAPSAGTDPNTPLYAAFLTPTGPVFVPAYSVAAGAAGGSSFVTTVPATGVSGQSYVILTACADRVSDDTTIAGPGLFEVAAA